MHHRYSSPPTTNSPQIANTAKKKNQQQGTSLLCKIVAVFKHPKLGQFLAMVNCLPTHVDTWAGLYDLKGSADDKVMVKDGARVPEVHKRCWQIGWMLSEATGCMKGVPPARMRYREGKKDAYSFPIYVTKEQREEILAAVREDVQLFDDFGLMDYSMIVGVHRPAPGEAATILAEVEKNGATTTSAAPLHSKPYAAQHAGDTTIVYLGIIDFLQAWTGGKQCAHIIKACCAPPPISTIAPKQYARQFEEFFHAKIRGVGYPLPPAYVDVEPTSGSITGLNAVTLATEVEELKSTVGYLHEKLARAEARIEELEEGGCGGGGEDRFVDAVSRQVTATSGVKLELP